MAAETKTVEAKSIDVDGVFKVFTACPNDPKTLLLDVRDHKDFKRKHINQAYCIRLSKNGKVLADYSQSQYTLPWSQDCWWGRPVIVYGPPSVGKDHPVVKFLAAEGRVSALCYLKPGFEAFEAKFPFLCTPSVKANSIKKYPSMILPGFLYLGDWDDASQTERLQEINIRRILTVHNHPERLAVSCGIRQMKVELPDIEGADISAHFNSAYEFLAEAERLKQPTLVHCGAGVSRSACIVMMYLMRSRLWSAQKSRDYCIAARSLVCPNDGFWRVLCALEGPLGILERSDPNDTMGFAGADAPDVKLNQVAAGQPVTVKMISAKELELQRALQQQQEAEVPKAAAVSKDATQAAEQPHQQKRVLRRGRSESRGRSRSSSPSSSTSSGSRSHSGRRHRSRSRSRGRRRNFNSSRYANHRYSSPSDEGTPDSSKRGRRDRSRSLGRDDTCKRRGPAAVPEYAADTYVAVAAPGAPVSQPGWLVTIEVHKPEGLVGHLVLGPMNIHQRVVFGRAPSCNVVLEHLSVSRQHAQLTVDLTGNVCVMDMGAQHGTKLGDTWLKPQQQRTVALGNQLRFGASTRAYKLLSVAKSVQK